MDAIIVMGKIVYLISPFFFFQAFVEELNPVIRSTISSVLHRERGEVLPKVVHYVGSFGWCSDLYCAKSSKLWYRVSPYLDYSIIKIVNLSLNVFAQKKKKSWISFLVFNLGLMWIHLFGSPLPSQGDIGCRMINLSFLFKEIMREPTSGQISCVHSYNFTKDVPLVWWFKEAHL